MLCEMPPLILPEDLLKQLQKSETGTINNTEKGPGVAVYWKTDRSARADIIVGLILDGYTLSRNLNSIVDDTRMEWSVPARISCVYGVIHFDPDEDGHISISVSYRSCRSHK